jgi:proteic killer suppression protein
VINTIKSKALKKAINKDQYQLLNPNHHAKIKMLTTALHSATCLKDLQDIPGGNLHCYKEKDIWSLDVSGNYRLLFKFNEANGEVNDLTYYDPH